MALERPELGTCPWRYVHRKRELLTADGDGGEVVAVFARDPGEGVAVDEVTVLVKDLYAY